MENNEQSIIKAAKEGNDWAVSALYETYQKKGIAFAVKYVSDYSTAEDMFQDSFMKALGHLDTFDDTKPFGPWLNTIIANTCKNYLVKKKATSFSDMSDEEMNFVDTIENTDAAFMPEQAFEKAEFVKIMDEIVSELPDAQRQALVLFYYKDMSVKQIAALQEVSEDTIKSRLNYSRKKVGAAVEAYQKKKGIRLYTIPLISFFLYMYYNMDISAFAAELPKDNIHKENTYSGNEAVISTAKVATKAAAGGFAKKILIGVAVLAIGAGGTAAGIHFAGQNDEQGFERKTMEARGEETEPMEKGHETNPESTLEESVLLAKNEESTETIDVFKLNPNEEYYLTNISNPRLSDGGTLLLDVCMNVDANPIPKDNTDNNIDTETDVSEHVEEFLLRNKIGSVIHRDDAENQSNEVSQEENTANDDGTSTEKVTATIKVSSNASFIAYNPINGEISERYFVDSMMDPELYDSGLNLVMSDLEFDENGELKNFILSILVGDGDN